MTICKRYSDESRIIRPSMKCIITITMHLTIVHLNHQALHSPIPLESSIKSGIIFRPQIIDPISQNYSWMRCTPEISPDAAPVHIAYLVRLSIHSFVQGGLQPYNTRPSSIIHWPPLIMSHPPNPDAMPLFARICLRAFSITPFVHLPLNLHLSLSALLLPCSLNGINNAA